MATLGEEVEAWLRANPHHGVPKAEWLARVVDAGWAVPTWTPEWYGRGLTGAEAVVIGEAFAAAGAPGSRQDRHNLWANTLLTFGTEELKRQLIRPLLLDEVTMCLLYSEPEAGSDLAGLRTRADRDGEGWIVTGQKVWTSNAAKADYGMLVARTDWSQPKHAGISFFFLPMRQPGVEVRPIKQITGESHFNEVFLDHAYVPGANLLGRLNDGWRVLQTALAYERSVMGDMARGPRRKQAVDDDGGAEVDLAAMARRHGRDRDPQVRQAVARMYSLRAVNRWNNDRGKAALQQGSSSPTLSLGKLAMSRILHEGAAVQARIIGAEALLDDEDRFPDAAGANFLALNAYFTSIGGGTDQIQRNIIGERLLGLPKEPEVDRGVPFADVVTRSRIREPG